MQVNSAFRTIAQQYLLYRWYLSGPLRHHGGGARPAARTTRAAARSTSRTTRRVVTAMSAHGWAHDVPGDPVHFDHLGLARHPRRGRARVPAAVEPQQPERPDRRGRRLRPADRGAPASSRRRPGSRIGATCVQHAASRRRRRVGRRSRPGARSRPRRTSRSRSRTTATPSGRASAVLRRDRPARSCHDASWLRRHVDRHARPAGPGGAAWARSRST